MTGGSDEAGQEVPTTSPAPTPQPGTLTSTGRDGWETWGRAAAEAHAPAVAWASTIPFDPADLAEDAPAIPIATIAAGGVASLLVHVDGAGKDAPTLGATCPLVPPRPS